MSDKEEAEMIERESTIKRLESMIDRAVVQLDAYQDLYESNYGELGPTEAHELKNEFCAFREYWIHKLKHKQP